MQFVPLPTVPDVLWAVHCGEVDEGVVPIENSIEGAVAVTLDMLAHDVEVRIRAEVVLPIRHALLVPSGLEERSAVHISTVYSHPQALAQCRKSLDRLLPGARRVPTSSTAEAARLVAAAGRPVTRVDRDAPGVTASGAVGTGYGTEGTRAAAVATHLAADIYGLDMWESDLQDRADNATRFIVLGSEDGRRTGRDKTSIVVGGGADRPGVLFRILQSFAERNINLTRIESRPAKRALGEYIFFVDLEGHQEDDAVAEALAQVQARAESFRILGSYPAWRGRGVPNDNV